MAGASDKARFYLEQSVPELKEYERKKIFTSPEITSIAKKRSDFEHKINARGSFPSDYARYAEFETNVDALRRKRVKRLGIRTPAHNGQRRIFFILDRGTRKFPGDVSLWMQSVEYARRQKAYKKLSQILTNVLRLHPTKPDLWIYAAQSAIDEHADMTEARSYMQRGLRFCKNSKKIWLEYVKLEMLYIAKIAARREILGIGSSRSGDAFKNGVDDMDTDVLQLPKLTSEDINPSLLNHDDIDEVALQTLDSTPAMSGAIPIAIFDAAMAQFQRDPNVGKGFFDVCSEFEKVPCLRKILNHITETLRTTKPYGWATWSCCVKAPVAGLDPSSVDFPAGLGVSLENLREALEQGQQKAQFAEDIRGWLEVLLEAEDMDSALRAIMTAKCRSLERIVASHKIDDAALGL